MGQDEADFDRTAGNHLTPALAQSDAEREVLKLNKEYEEIVRARGDA